MHGLSTLNRLLGKKNKEASRSTSNLSKSTTNLDTSSQHNKISPIVSNAPFEQTFRVTVYLPKNQLYVERIGAKTKLTTLMDKICENKDLTHGKYEFRHPGDASQVFDIDKTIGEVGLNELKLVLKTESRYNSDFHRFHADDMLKYKSSVPDSVSSSEISRNYNKNVLHGKPSPYSSTTSLNSLDSTGMNLTAKMQPPVAPARKKRAAPRPPSQNSIPEQEIFGTTLNVFKEPHSILPKKNFHVSSPQLFNNNIPQELKGDKNNNFETNGNRLNAITRPTSLYVTSTTEISQNGSVGHQRSPSESSEVQQIFLEMQNSSSLEKKKKPAPVPPKRTHKPVPSPRTVQEESKPPTITEIKEIDEHENPSRLEEKLPENHANVSKTMLNNVATPEEHPSIESSEGPISIQIISSDSSIEHVKEEPARTISPKLPAVSKVHIKPEEERRSSSEDEMTVNVYNVTKSIVTLEKNHALVSSSTTASTFTSKSEAISPNHETKSVSSTTISTAQTTSGQTQHFTSSTTFIEKDQARIEANVEKRHPQIEPVEVETVLMANRRVSIEKSPPSIEERKKPLVREVPVEIERSPSPLWTYTLPAPPIFADSSVVDKVTPTDQSKHGENKMFSDFASTCNETILSDSNTTIISAETIHPIIVNRKPSVEKFIATPDGYTKEVADDESDKSTEIITSDLEDGYLGNGKIAKANSPPQTNGLEKEIVIDDFIKSRLIISRSDSFHSIGPTRNFDAGAKRSPYNPPQRSTSFLSLVQSQRGEIYKSSSDNAPYSRQKSTSELSISDVPCLQSIEVLKNILNSSRKNSLQDTSPIEEKVETFVQSFPVESVKKQEETVIKSERKSYEVMKEAKAAEPQWRYSGPPKINLSTWNERPKVDVAIAADSDYKFGIGTATLQREFKNHADSSSKRHTIHISNEHAVTTDAEKNSKPKVLGVEYKKAVSPALQLEPSSPKKETPPVYREIHVVNRESVVVNREPQVVTKESEVIYREPQVVLREVSAPKPVAKPSRTIINITPRPMSMDVTNSYSTIVTSTSKNSTVSFNRLNSNAKKFTPVVHGFKMNNINESDKTDSAGHVVNRHSEVPEKRPVAPPHVPAKPSFLRSSSSGDMNRNTKFSIVSAADSKPDESSIFDLPFSQTGLRKTGLKERILQSDKNTKSIFGRVVETKEVSQPVSENHVERVTLRSNSHPVPVPPKPPTAPPPMSFRKSAPIDMDTRHQLLDAIKSFNIDSLRNK